jgi:methyl-accepting chemotaxis protein
VQSLQNLKKKMDELSLSDAMTQVIQLLTQLNDRFDNLDRRIDKIATDINGVTIDINNITNALRQFEELNHQNSEAVIAITDKVDALAVQTEKIYKHLPKKPIVPGYKHDE